MGKLVIKFNNDVVDHIDLKQGDMKIGRKPGCEILLDNLAVSGEHANIFTVGDDSFIQDLGSTNGTFINNKKITKHHLKNGDAVVIGKHTLIYLTESAHAKEPDDFAKTVIINPASITREIVEPREAKPASEPAAITVETAPKNVSQPRVDRHGAIFVLSGVNSGKRIELTKKLTNLGKTGKRAGTISQVDDGYLLVPGEDEIPKLNGRPISKDGAKLKNGDIIEVAGTRLQFYLK
ncbi:MAG TPA: FHA domain-containing protein [Candidatus Methylomirabilis sp.]|nr:FHA domain-containing protein [Candidatus Methylomirabilis sp.]